MPQKTIAIVGGGACGTATFIHLVLKLIVRPDSEPVSFALIEKRDEIGPGLAYDTGQKGHLLNTSANLMGIFVEEPGHFVEWMEQHRDAIQAEYPDADLRPNGYPPRQLYGKYLTAMFDEYVGRARQHGMEVRVYHEEAVDAEVTEAHITLTLESGETIRADAAVLATGTPKSNTFKHLEESPNYLDSPWPSGRILETITNPEADVCILGASLTAIDAVITLVNNGHTGRIKLYSKDGLLPRVQSPEEVPFEREILTLSNVRKTIREEERALRVKDLFRLFMAEAERVMGPQDDWKRFNRVDKDQLELLEDDIEQALRGDSHFQNILYSTRYISAEVWKLLPPDQKVLFTKWLKPHSDVNRHAMPLQNGEKLRDLLRSGQLSVTAHSEKIAWNEAQQRFDIHTEDGRDDTATYLINATGPATDLKKMPIRLIERMVEKGYLQPYQPGGACVDVQTLCLEVPAVPCALLYGIGHLIVGELFDTNSVWFNVAQIDPLTDSLLKRLDYGRTA
jgi:uncharacterized NAD(P)/FAD-binding protein YdhS